MAIAIIVENGSVVEGANSFATVQEAKDYALLRGVVLASNDDAIAAMLIKAMDYIRLKTFAGELVSGFQMLPFPRTHDSYEDNIIPGAIKEAQLRLVLEINAGVDLMPTIVPGSFVKKEKIGPIETEFSETVNAYSAPQMPFVDILLAPYLAAGMGGGFRARTLRI